MPYNVDSVVTTSTTTAPITQDNQFYEDAPLYEYNQHNSEIGIPLSLQRKGKKTDKIICKATHPDDDESIQDGKLEHEVMPQNNLNRQVNVSPTAITTANTTGLSMPENLSTNQHYSKDDINPVEFYKQTYSVVIFRTESINDVVSSLNSSLPEIDYNNSTKDWRVNPLGERNKKSQVKSMAGSQKVDKKVKSHSTKYNGPLSYDVIELTRNDETLSSFKTIPITYSIKPTFTLINDSKWSNMKPVFLSCVDQQTILYPLGDSLMENNQVAAVVVAAKNEKLENDRLKESETTGPTIEIITEPIVPVFQPTEIQIKIYSPQHKEKTTTFPPNLTPAYISASAVTTSEGDELPHRTNSIEKALQDTSQKSSENRNKRLYLNLGKKPRTLKKHANKGVNHAPLKTTPIGSRTKSPSSRKIMTNYSPTKSPHKRRINNSPKDNYQPLTRLSNKTVRQQPSDKSVRSQTISPTLRNTPLKSVNSVKMINCERKRTKSAPNRSLSSHHPPASIGKLIRTDDKQDIYEASVHLFERINKRLKKYKRCKSLHQQAQYKHQTTMSPTLRRLRSKSTEMKTRIKSSKMKFNELNSKHFHFRKTNMHQSTRSNTSSLSESISEKQLKYKHSPTTAIRKLKNRDNASNSTSLASLLENQCYNLPLGISKSDYRLTSPGILVRVVSFSSPTASISSSKLHIKACKRI
ncbi:unnamed protein product [Trichobilharzia szidati]|nr:unnamed protein product [Trichobilharzia szidati]